MADSTTKKQIQFELTANDKASKAFNDLSKTVNDAVNKLNEVSKSATGFGQASGVAGMGAKELMGIIAGGTLVAKGAELAIKALVGGVQELGQYIQDSVAQAAKFETAMLGLQSVAMAYGKDADAVVEASKRLASDGLLAPAEAAEALKNTLAALPNLTLDQAESMVAASKETAAFNRVLNDYGDAVLQTSRGLRNRNSILTDSAGIQKNLAVIMKEAGYEMEDLDSATEGANAQQALFEGWMRESAFAVGDLNTFMDTYSGKLAQVSASSVNLSTTIGNIFMPAFTAAKDVQGEFLSGLGQWFAENEGKLQSLVRMITENVMGAFRELANTFHFVQGSADSTILPVLNAIIDGFIQLGNIIKIVANVVQNGIDTMGTGLANFFDLIRAGVSAIKGNFEDAGQQLNDISGRTTTWMENVSKNNEDIMTAMTRMTSTTTFDLKKFWSGLDNSVQKTMLNSKDAIDRTTDAIDEKAVKALQKYLDAVRKLNESFDDQMAQRKRSYQQNLNDLLIAHRDNTNKIKDDMVKETQSYEKELTKRTEAYKKQIDEINGSADEDKQDVLEKYDEETKQIKENLRKQLADNTDSDVTLIELAKRTIEEKATERDKELAKIEADRQKDLTDAKDKNDEQLEDLKATHDEKMTTLQTQLDKEMEIQKKYAKDFAKIKDTQAEDDITRLKNNYAYELQLMKEQHEKKLKELEREYKAEQKVKSGSSASSASKSAGSGSNNSDIKNSSSDSAPAYTPVGGVGTQVGSWKFTSNGWVKAYAQGGLVEGVGPVPITAHGGEVVLTPNHVAGLLKILEKGVTYEKTGTPNNQYNTINATIKGDYDVDSIVRRLSFRQKFGGN